MAAPASQSCGNCRYFSDKDIEGEQQGRCHRYPPSIGGNAWPTVNVDRWCGEWKTATE